jgi:soluble lytic murein transglycosylase-like protein
MRIGHILTALTISATACVMAPFAYADVYGYIDAEGIAHFSAEKLDDRYQLFMRGSKPAVASQLKQARPPAETKTPLSSYLSQHPNLKKYEVLLDEAAREFNLDPALLKAVMAAESGFNPNAVSPKGAVGLMQVMPATAQRYGLQADKNKSVAQKLADPKTNIRLGARYLRDLHKMFPAMPHLVLASYNAGEGAVQKYKNTIPPYPETRNYVQVVTEFYRLYKPSAPSLAIAAGLQFDTSGDGGDGGTESPSKRIRITIPAAITLNPSPMQGRGKQTAPFSQERRDGDTDGRSMPASTLE